jgi:hypothetical protein
MYTPPQQLRELGFYSSSHPAARVYLGTYIVAAAAASCAAVLYPASLYRYKRMELGILFIYIFEMSVLHPHDFVTANPLQRFLFL